MTIHSLRFALPGAALLLLAACGKPIETKEELLAPVAGASVPATAARGASLALFAQAAEAPEQLPVPAITVTGTHGGSATLSVNPVGVVVGLVGKGLLFDIEYDGYSVDGIHWLDGKLSVLANFEYLASDGEAPEANFEVSLVGTVGISGLVSDEVRLNLKVKTNLQDLIDNAEQLKLRLNGSITASRQEFEFLAEDVVLDWVKQEG